MGEQRLRHVLAGQRFPAARWELICSAEIYSVDEVSRSELRNLPEGTYASIGMVIWALQKHAVQRRSVGAVRRGSDPMRRSSYLGSA